MFAVTKFARNAPFMHHARKMATIVDGVNFNNVAREWRMKWTTDNEKKSLADIQKVVDTYLKEIKSNEGVHSVQRVVCGGCHDYKLVVALDTPSFGKWSGIDFHPEKTVLEALSKIPGVTQIETQTYTLEKM